MVFVSLDVMGIYTWTSINALCGNGKLGPAEMMLFYAFHQADGNLKASM